MVNLVTEMRQGFLLTLFLLSLQGFAQSPHAILKSLSAYKQPKGILVRWVIKGGQQCNGTRIYRAGNALQFEEVNHIPGICGNFTDDETYSYFDSLPQPNQYNHYKLELGFQGFTDTVTAFFEDFGKADHFVFSDQQNNTHRILFSNDLNSKAVLRVFDRMGNEVYTETTTSSDFFIRPSGWRAGVYLFRIAGVSEVDIHGKIYFADQ